MRLREALVRSRNLVSIRLLRALGTPYAIDYISKFGFPKASLPTNLTLALGTVQVTPLELAAGYADHVLALRDGRLSDYEPDRAAALPNVP